MAAPDSTVWGGIYGSKGKIGIYTSVSSNNTTTTVNVQVWVWTVYSCYDYNNNLYLDVGTGVSSATTLAGSAYTIYHTVDTGAKWNTSNQTKLLDKTYTYSRGTSSTTYKVYAKLSDVDLIGTPMYANTSFTVPALTSYTVTYNANGGSGAPSSQTKYYGTAITLSSTKPTRTGYTFRGWGTSSSTTTVSYAAGATYSTNASITLYAIWKANTYTVTYNANGGSGAPSSQTKTYGVTLTLSSTKPTRTNYTFLGWGTSASATTVSYNPGASYTTDADITLYAVWSLAYTKPRITNYSVDRCDKDGNISDTETYAYVCFDWACDYTVTSVTIEYKLSTESTYTVVSVSASGKSGSVSKIIGDGALDTDSTYDVRVTVADSNDSSYTATTLGGTLYTVDFLASGNGVAFGKPAEKYDAAEFNFNVYFNKPVHGPVVTMLGNDEEIVSNCDFNNYLTPGTYAVALDEDASAISNIPVNAAGVLRVYNSTGRSSADSEHTYLIQEYRPYLTQYLTHVRSVYTSGAESEWTYTNWRPLGGVDAPVWIDTSGIWTFRLYNSGLVECWGKYPITDVACTTAVGSMYRTAYFQPDDFPFTIQDPYVFADYETAGYGGFLWACTKATTTKPPRYYLFRPTTATVTGTVKLYVKGIATF